MKTGGGSCRFIHKANIKYVFTGVMFNLKIRHVSSISSLKYLLLGSNRSQSKSISPCSFYHFRNWTNIIPSKWWAERKNVSPASTMVSLLFGINSLNFGRVPRYTWTVWMKKITPAKDSRAYTKINFFKGDFCWTVGHL